jgi:hypothetical protein
LNLFIASFYFYRTSGIAAVTLVTGLRADNHKFAWRPEADKLPWQGGPLRVRPAGSQLVVFMLNNIIGSSLRPRLENAGRMLLVGSEAISRMERVPLANPFV